ncbi:hypothetical protein Celaphus_00015834, partial [Cervus elaphus hippelaphus]
MAYPGYGGGFGNFGNPVGQPGYPGHPAYPGSISTGDPMWKCFLAIAGQDGEVGAEDLQKCLTQSGISGTYSPFSLETCRIMIAMLDRDYTGKMGFNEFKELWAALNSWKQNFVTVDKDGSYRLSPQTVTTIVKRYGKNGRIFFDDYVACCVKLRALTGLNQTTHILEGIQPYELYNSSREFIVELHECGSDLTREHLATETPAHVCWKPQVFLYSVKFYLAII